MRKLLVVLLLVCGSANAQTVTDPVAHARALAIAGNRTEAIQILEQRLAAAPADIDARTLLGIVLSWDHQYDRARAELQRVLAQDPNNEDAQQALARVEQWSRQTAPQSELLFGANYDDYGNSDPFREVYESLKLDNRVAPVVLRAAYAQRFDTEDVQFDAEAYPHLGAKTYAYLAAGYSPNARLYPRSRFGAELFQNFGKGWEASAGGRRLNFSEAVNVYTASLGKYIGHWYLDARGYKADRTDAAGVLIARYYFGDNGAYAGLRAGHGSTRDEFRSGSDLASLTKTDVAAEARLVIHARWLVEARASDRSASLALGYRY